LRRKNIFEKKRGNRLLFQKWRLREKNKIEKKTVTKTLPRSIVKYKERNFFQEIIKCKKGDGREASTHLVCIMTMSDILLIIVI
jgi:hypothetical protein